jgi:Tol biopolymer transport system component
MIQKKASITIYFRLIWMGLIFASACSTKIDTPMPTSAQGNLVTLVVTPTLPQKPPTKTTVPTLAPTEEPTTPTPISRGERVAIGCKVDNVGKICIINPDGSNLVKLDSNPLIGGYLQLSPSGEKIIYTRRVLPDISLLDLSVIDSDGSNPIDLSVIDRIDKRGMENSVLLMLANPPTWSEDGKKVTFAVGDIYTVNVEDSTLTRLTESFTSTGPLFAPSWSPDGKKIAFLNSNYSGVCVINVDGTNRICNDEVRNGTSSPTWSPDGQKIAFSGYKTLPSIYVINTDGTKLTELASFQDSIEVVSPSWSPDGEKIALIIHSLQPAKSELAVINIDGSNLTSFPGTNNVFDYAWSPDSKMIAYNSDQGIYIIEVDSLNVRKLINGIQILTNISWSP